MARGLAVARWLLAMSCILAPCQAQVKSTPMPLLPASVAYDAAGNLYFADTNRQQVYESSLAGTLTVVAGSGVQGFSGDGGPAIAAELNAPQGVAVGPDGTLYIADTGNERIREVSGGVISTFAGSGAAGFSGDGGPAATASFRTPNALAIDASGALLVCDAGNQRVRRISGGIIATMAGDGLQGFGGDGGAATAAELDTPMGLAVGGDGRIFISDSHNQRIRVIGTNGVISTFAGSGVRGFSGDGGPATQADLSLPRGIVAAPGGAVIFADSDNQRLRMVTAAGVISTVLGTGLQGAIGDGSPSVAAEMNSPRGIAVSSFGALVYADTLNRLVRESTSSGKVYLPGGLASQRTSSVTLNVMQSGSGAVVNATATTVASDGIPQGTVDLLDGSRVLAQASLNAGIAAFPKQILSAGTHSLRAAYLGDGIHPASVSAPFSLNAATAVITATATAASVAYGQPIPPLVGSIAGVLPQDAGKVSAVFTTSAQMLSPVGSYPILATLTGPSSAGYSVVMSPASGTLQVLQAASMTAEQPIAQASYAGLPLLLTANVTAAGAGTPTGTVQFLAGGTVVAAAVLVQGSASATYLAPPAGNMSVIAEYGGDRNFRASSSQVMTATVAAVPDFTLATAGSTTQTVGAGQVASYPITVTAQSGTFTGVVDLSAKGLPTNATASFSPPQLVPGNSSATVTMTVQTSPILTTLTMLQRYGGAVFMSVLLPWVWLRRRGCGALRTLSVCGVLTMLMGVSGCGARTSSAAALGAQTYTITVIGTSTNLAGAVVSHTAQVTLIVE